MGANLILDLAQNITSFDELNEFTKLFNLKLKTEYNSVTLKIPKNYSIDRTYLPYDLLTFFSLFYKDKTIILEKDLYTKDLSFIFHFLCHTDKSEIRVIFDINKLSSLIEYSVFKNNISILTECITYNGFNSNISIIHDEEFIKNYSSGILNDYINFIKNISNIKLYINKQISEEIKTSLFFYKIDNNIDFNYNKENIH